MKIYTDIEQSKKLAEFLPLESADMVFAYCDSMDEYTTHPRVLESSKNFDIYKRDIPCWSLTALLDVLPVSCDDGHHCLALINPNPNDKTEWLCAYEDCKGDLIMECYADNSVDVCYEMILKLHELKLL